MSTSFLVKCNECGNEWMARPQHLLRGHKCRKCALKQRDCSNNKKKSTQVFINDLLKVTNNIKILSEYINAHTAIDCECKICGNQWSAQPANLLSGYGCPTCGNTLKHTKQSRSEYEFVERLKEISPDIQILSKYYNNHTNIQCKCLQCGYVWSATPANLLRGTGCPKHKSSKGERRIIQWLNENNIDFVFQKRFQDLLGIGGREMPYDFYIPKINALIEYQGNFHDKTDRLQTDEDYKVRVKHDELKKNYARLHNMKYFEIWYYDDIEDKLNEIIKITDPVTITVM